MVRPVTRMTGNPTYDQRIMPEPNSGCWLWVGSIDPRPTSGYGRLWVGHRVTGSFKPAHRLVYEYMVGPVPEGLTLDHKCRVRQCVNPQHLEPVTNRENILRGVSPLAKQARQTHCKWGHELAGSNVYASMLPARYCVACTRRRSNAATKARRV